MLVFNLDVIKNYILSMDSITSRSEVSPVLVLGSAGAGKSTLVNYLLGCHFLFNSLGELVAHAESMPAEIRGNKVPSETLYPTIHTSQCGLALYDCPAFDDTRSDEMRLCISVLLEHVVKQYSSIAGVILVVDYYSIDTMRGSTFCDFIEHVSALFRFLDDVSRHVILFINKTPERVTKNHVINKIRTLERLSNVNFLGSIISNINNVCLVDPSDGGRARGDIVREINSLLSLNAKDLSFCNDPIRSKFKAYLAEIIRDAVDKMHDYELLKDEITHINEACREISIELGSKDNERQALQRAKSDELNVAFLKKETEDMIIENTATLSSKRKKRDSLHKKIEALKLERDKLNSDEPVLFWEKKHNKPKPMLSPDSIPVKVGDMALSAATSLTTIGLASSLVNNPISNSIKLVNKFFPSDQKVTFSYKGPPIAKVESKFDGGRVNNERQNAVDGIYSAEFVGEEYKAQYAEVLIYVKSCLHPGNIKRIHLIDNELAAKNDCLAFVAKNIKLLEALLVNMEYRLSSIRETRQEESDEDVLSRIDAYIESLRYQQVSYYENKLSKEKEVCELEEELAKTRHLYELTAQLLPLLSNVNLELDSSDELAEFLKVFYCPIKNLEVDISPEKAADSQSCDEMASMRKEINALKDQVAVLTETIQNLSTVVTELVTREQAYQLVKGVSDDDCGYSVFNIPRHKAHQLLLDNLLNISCLITVAIKDVLFSSDFYNYLHAKTIVNNTWEEFVADEEKLVLCLSNIDVQRAYLDYDVQDRSLYSGFSHPAVLQALAYILCIDLHMWRLGGNKELVPYIILDAETNLLYALDHIERRVDLLFHSDGHYDELNINSARYERIESHVSPLSSPGLSLFSSNKSCEEKPPSLAMAPS